MPRDVDDPNESEFGMGPGVIDPDNRSNRILEGFEELREIYALPKTFDGSGGADGLPTDPAETPVPRLLPGETETDRA